MTYTYQKVKDINGENITNLILRKEDQALIPFDDRNIDYQEYLTWIAKGNTPEDIITWDDIRTKRDKILKDTDWTMTTGATVDQGQWAAYRQNIRDIPQTYKGKTANEVIWPIQPSTKGPNS